MNFQIVIVIMIVCLASEAKALSDECNSVSKMADCCRIYLKSEKQLVSSADMDMGHQCKEEIEGALDQTREEKRLGACVPAGITTDSMINSFISFSDNNPYFYMRSPRFGLLYLITSKWPCSQ